MQVREGDVLSIPCKGCKSSITWLVPHGNWWEYIPQYHSKSCRNRASRRLNKSETVFKCPHPYKKNYTLWDDAHQEAMKQAKHRKMLYAAYRCRCGGFHVGHREVRRAK